MIACTIGSEAIAAIAARRVFVFIVAGLNSQDGRDECKPRAIAVNKSFKRIYGTSGASTADDDIPFNSPPNPPRRTQLVSIVSRSPCLIKQVAVIICTVFNAEALSKATRSHSYINCLCKDVNGMSSGPWQSNHLGKYEGRMLSGAS